MQRKTQYACTPWHHSCRMQLHSALLIALLGSTKLRSSSADALYFPDLPPSTDGAATNLINTDFANSFARTAKPHFKMFKHRTRADPARARAPAVRTSRSSSWLLELQSWLALFLCSISPHNGQVLTQCLRDGHSYKNGIKRPGAIGRQSYRHQRCPCCLCLHLIFARQEFVCEHVQPARRKSHRGSWVPTCSRLPFRKIGN